VLDDNPCVADVRAAFDGLPNPPAALAVWMGDQSSAEPAAWPRYTGEAENTYGFDNHFQSVQRLRAGPYAVISGSDVNAPLSQLFLAHLPSRCGAQRWGSNLDGGVAPRRPEPPSDDAITEHVDLERDRWHPGGLAALGDLLAAGLDHGAGNARVAFFDASKPPALTEVASFDLAGNRSDAVGLARADDGRVLMAIRASDHFEFHRSRTAEVKDGFETDAGTSTPDVNDLQNIALVKQCDGSLFMLGFHNTSDGSPIIAGDDEVILYALDAPFGTPPRRVATRTLDCDGGYCNFDAAAGAYVTDQGQLLLYGAPHFRQLSAPTATSLLLKLAEF
jgi:hypothetical protein